MIFLYIYFIHIFKIFGLYAQLRAFLCMYYFIVNYIDLSSTGICVIEEPKLLFITVSCARGLHVSRVKFSVHFVIVSTIHQP